MPLPPITPLVAPSVVGSPPDRVWLRSQISAHHKQVVALNEERDAAIGDWTRTGDASAKEGIRLLNLQITRTRTVLEWLQALDLFLSAPPHTPHRAPHRTPTKERP
jgi:hypothetical protein